MANIRKTFNFRNGVQVDDDNLIVSPTGLVGIGTSVPTEYLDVRGTEKIVGLVTASQIFTNSLTVGLTTDGNLGVATISSANIGVATVLTKLTAANLSISSGIVTVTSGVVTFYGDGSGLYNIPTSQWVDTDVGLGFTSIYSRGNVGVATVDPRFTFQVGGNNDVGNFQLGVGINSTGDILATGIISATTLRGDGSLITGINASNITSGTLNNSRLPANLNISGVSTFLQSLNITQNLNVGGASTLTGPLSVSTITSSLTVTESLSVGGSSTITGSLSVGGPLNVSGVTTLSSLNISGATTLSSLNVSGVTTLSSLNVSGVTTLTGPLTVGFITATTSFIGVSTATNLQVNSVRLGVSGNSEIDTTSGNLTLNSTDGTVVVNDNLSVSGISTFTGEVRIDTGIIPDISTGAYIGTSGKPFSEAYINAVEIGVGFSNRIRSLSGNLLLDSTNNQVNVNTNFYVTGIATFNDNLNVANNVLPVSDLSVNLGSNTKRFNQAYISAIQVGAALSNKINTNNNTDLILDSATGTTFVDDNLKVSGLGTFSGLVISNQGFVPATDSSVSLGTPSLRFSEAHIDNIRIGVAQTNVIDTVNSDLILNSSTGITQITDDLYVTGIGSFTGEITSNLGFVPDNDLGAYIGTAGKRFDAMYTDKIYSNDILIGISSGTIQTNNQILSLSSSGSQIVSIQNYLHVKEKTLPLTGSEIGVGIGTTNPIGAFQVGVENDFATTVVALASTIGISTTIITGINTSGITIGLKILELVDIIATGTTVISIGSSQVGIGTTTLNDIEQNDVALTFGTGYVNDRVFAINSTKSVGIGTTNPSAKLDVRGDARVGINTSAGVVLTSANGTKYRLIVSNAGVLSTVLVP